MDLCQHAPFVFWRGMRPKNELLLLPCDPLLTRSIRNSSSILNILILVRGTNHLHTCCMMTAFCLADILCGRLGIYTAKKNALIQYQLIQAGHGSKVLFWIFSEHRDLIKVYFFFFPKPLGH